MYSLSSIHVHVCCIASKHIRVLSNCYFLFRMCLHIRAALKAAMVHRLLDSELAVILLNQAPDIHRAVAILNLTAVNHPDILNRNLDIRNPAATVNHQLDKLPRRILMGPAAVMVSLRAVRRIQTRLVNIRLRLASIQRRVDNTDNHTVHHQLRNRRMEAAHHPERRHCRMVMAAAAHIPHRPAAVHHIMAPRLPGTVLIVADTEVNKCLLLLVMVRALVQPVDTVEEVSHPSFVSLVLPRETDLIFGLYNRSCPVSSALEIDQVQYLSYLGI